MRLLPDDANSIFEGGHLFFLRDGTLMALPFDLAQRKSTAEAFPVAENVAIAVTTSMVPFLWRETALWRIGVTAEWPTIASWSGWTAPAGV